MELAVAGAGNQVQVADAVFAQEYNEGLVHQVVTAYQAGARAGTHAQKTRSEVKASGSKPWRQKGTGRARAGTVASPIWRSGGVAFAAKPRDYSQKVNRKMYRAAMRSILSELLRKDRVKIVDSFAIAEPKTKALVAKLKELEVNDVLIIADDIDKNLYLSARNLPRVYLCDAQAIDPVSLLTSPQLIITVAALKQLEERLA